MVDIHNYERQYIDGERRLRASAISDRNKELILRYRDACLLHGVCAKVRLIRTFDVLGRCAVLLGKDYDAVTRRDLELLITGLLRTNRKPATIATYKAILKRFLGWVCCPDEFPRLTTQPAVIAWMTVHLKRRDEKTLQRTVLLTPDDIDRLLQVCHCSRDKAFVSMLWETGGRISELGNLEVGHVTSHAHGYILDINGKTGRRSPLIVSSAPHLATWLAHHPFRHDQRSPLWVHYQSKKRAVAIDYDAIRAVLKRLFLRAGITKPFHPHLFRHSRATHVLANGIMTDSQARQYFGWTPSSTMIGRYAHLVDGDAHNALLRENNLAPLTPAPNKLQTVQCQRCNARNIPTAKDCTTCTLPLDARAAYADTQHERDTQTIVLQLAKVLVEQGLLEQAVSAIHEADLGRVLERLATKHKQEQAEEKENFIQQC